jgi:hypothetical protein
VAFVSHMRFSLDSLRARRGALLGGAAAALTTALTGCGLGGALHQATLVGQCAGDDAACSRRHPQAPLAIGARFYPEVATDLAGTTTPSLRLESAIPAVVDVDRGALVGRSSGSSVVLISTEDGAVVDFVQVWVAAATHISLARRDGDRVAGPIALTVGEDVTLVPALWNGAQRLAGDGDVTWSQTADAPLAILRDGSADRRRLRARAPGATTVTAALGDVQATVDIEVVR